MISDVVEIDAASNNGVDEIRDIRDKVKYLPSEGKYKVYIIDEVHMLSTGAFNALLKTLEEPPVHAIFILATTEPHKIPATILSRCQILNLLPTERANIKEEVLEKGVSIDDTEILSSLYNNVDTIMNNLEDENYKVCKECLFDTLDSLEQSPLKGLLYVQSELINKIKTKEQARLYLDLLAIAFKDILLAQLEQDITLEIYKKTINTIAKNLKGVEKIYLEIMLSRGKIESNISISLLLEHIFITMIQGGNVNGK
jgi:DNA polymerase III delta prime subunit